MILADDEFKTIMDSVKVIHSDIIWRRREGRGYALSFRADIDSAFAYSLFVGGYFIPRGPSLSFSLVKDRQQRIYGLDIGSDHRDPSGSFAGKLHKHRWSEHRGDEKATYTPSDITAPASDPMKVWLQFCAEANIEHKGRMFLPPSYHKEMP